MELEKKVYKALWHVNKQIKINYKIQSNINYANFHLTFLWFFFIFVLAIMKISSYNRFLVLHACLSNSSLKSKRVEVEMKKWFTVWKKKKQKLIMDNRINALWFYRLLNFIFRKCSYLLFCDLLLVHGSWCQQVWIFAIL